MNGSYWFHTEADTVDLSWPMDTAGSGQDNWDHRSLISINGSLSQGTKGIKVGESFLLGSLNFKNGFNSADNTTSLTEAAVDIRIQGLEYDGLVVNDPGTDFEVTDTWRIGIYQQANGADAIYFMDFPQLGSFWVPEGTYGSVDIYAKFGSIDAVEFRNPSDGTLSPNIPSGPVNVPDAGNLAGLFTIVCAGLFAVASGRRAV